MRAGRAEQLPGSEPPCQINIYQGGGLSRFFAITRVAT